MKKLVSVKTILIVNFCFLFFVVFANVVSAQFQPTPFSGNDPDSYQCVLKNGGGVEDQSDGAQIVKNPITGKFQCLPGDKYLPQAVLKPPTIQQIEIWFFRILYVVWTLVALFSFFMLVLLGYRYMITRGDVTKITEIRQKIIYYLVGFALVFLAVPILTTFFSVLGINDDVQCYDVEMPGFKFFWSELCTDPLNRISEDPCAFTPEQVIGVTCSSIGRSAICNIDGQTYRYSCSVQQVIDGDFPVWSVE